MACRKQGRGHEWDHLFRLDQPFYSLLGILQNIPLLMLHQLSCNLEGSFIIDVTLAPQGSISPNCTQLYQYAQLEVTPNFYNVRSMLCTRKINTNLLAQILLKNDDEIDPKSYILFIDLGTVTDIETQQLKIMLINIKLLFI